MHNTNKYFLFLNIEFLQDFFLCFPIFHISYYFTCKTIWKVYWKMLVTVNGWFEILFLLFSGGNYAGLLHLFCTKTFPFPELTWNKYSFWKYSFCEPEDGLKLFKCLFRHMADLWNTKGDNLDTKMTNSEGEAYLWVTFASSLCWSLVTWNLHLNRPCIWILQTKSTVQQQCGVWVAFIPVTFMD